MNKTQQIKMLLTALSIGLIIAVWCQGIEFFIKSDAVKIDILYQSYLAAGFVFILGVLFMVIKSNISPKNNIFPAISYLFAILSICFLVLYQPFFDCLREGDRWDNAKGCIHKKQTN